MAREVEAAHGVTRIPIAVACLLGMATGVAGAGPADVVAARATCTAARVCRFDVTVRHADEGWEHYADRWEVLSPAGELLAVRVLQHPHVDEQPFTRSLEGVQIPAGVDRVRIRAHDSKHGLGGAEVTVALPRLPAPERGRPGSSPP
jgi:hypothetical protein